MKSTPDAVVWMHKTELGDRWRWRAGKALSLLLGAAAQFAMMSAALAQGASGSGATLQATQPNAADSGVLIPFQYVPTPRWSAPASAPAGTDQAAAAQKVRAPEHQRLYDAYTAGNYTRVASDGLALLGDGSLDAELRFFIANSLAWTGKSRDAVTAYQGLLNSPYAAQARVGMANSLRWTGAEHLAVRQYAEVLRSNPRDSEAQQGMRLVQRELRPRTAVTVGGTRDISDTETRSAVLSHRWRSQDLANVWEVETGAYQTENPTVLVRQGDALVRLRAMETRFRPTVELSTNGKTVFGNLAVEVGGLPLVMDVGRLNWGRVSNNANGLANQLTANRAGVRVNHTFALGGLMARADFARVSDGNTVTSTAFRYGPSWRPLGPNIKPMLSIETRHVKFATKDYWSPAAGYASFNAGLMAEWSQADWFFYVAGQRGWRISGEAGDSWNGSIAGKRWIAENWALGFNLWAMSSVRDGAPYRARTAYVTAERLWE